MYTKTIEPRFGDADGMGHITNTALPLWFERARNPLYRIFNPGLDLKKWNLVMARLEVEYKGELFYGRDVEVRSFVSRIGKSSFDVAQEAWQDGSLRATGKVVLVHVDLAHKRPAPLPPSIRRELEKHLPGA
ncbi:MAG: thioesterase family protein [Chlamydiota bacterium]